jgi:non-heme chloroperoxidase
MEHQMITSRDGTHLFSSAKPVEGSLMLFLPGVGVSSAWWNRQFSSSVLAAHFLVTCDLRGHGASDKPTTPEAYQSSETWAYDVQAVIEAWNLTRPLLVSWSYGAHAVIDYLRYFGQESIRGVVFVDANFEIGTPFAQGAVAPEAWGLFEKIGSPEAATFRDGLAYGLQLLSDKIAPADYTVFLGAMAAVRPDVWGSMFARQTDNADLLGSLKLPVLIVHGRHDHIFTMQSSERLASLIPNSRLVHFETGHAPFYEEAESFNRLILEL